MIGPSRLRQSPANRSAPEAPIFQIACFSLGNEKYGIDIMKVKEVTRHHPVTRLPKAPAYIEGVIDLRGMIIPVADMRKRLDLPSAEPTARTRIIIASVRDKILGLIVDEAREVFRVPASAVKPPPQFVSAVSADYLVGVVERDNGLIFLLDFNAMFSMDETLAPPARELHS